VRDVLVLCYHGVSDDWPDEIAIPAERMERQLAELLDAGYVGATFTDAVLDPSARRTLAVTFDDGYRSVLERGLPVLERLGLPGTIFVPSRLIGVPQPVGWEGTDQWLDTPHAHELSLLGWDELAGLADAGWEVGSHTRTHPKLPRLDDAALDEELATSRHEVEQGLGRPCTSLAYPYGLQDRRVEAAARRAGYLAAGGLLPDRLSTRRPQAFPRVMIGRGYDHATFRRRVDPRARRVQSGRAWPLVARGVRAANLIRSRAL
jgi:peptidoglycan/xylan/chitin deacetylase (PgdA/CDA1 family)